MASVNKVIIVGNLGADPGKGKPLFTGYQPRGFFH